MTFHYLCHGLAAGLTLALFSPLAAAIAPEQIFVQVSPSVVVVDIFDTKGKTIGQGSGAVIGAGQVITNCHVAQNGKSLRVRQSGKTFKATLQYADPDRDLCQLSAPDLQAPPVVLGTAKQLRVGTYPNQYCDRGEAGGQESAPENALPGRHRLLVRK